MAIDSRYALAAAHVSYIQSLRNIGTALRRYAEAEVLIETSLSTVATAEPDKTPSHSSYPSPSPSHLCGASDTPISPQVARVSYMRSGAAPALTVRLNPNPRNVSLEESEFSMPPPQPLPPDESGPSWDYFDPVDESFKFVGQNGLDRNMDDDDYDNDDDKKEFDLNGNGGGDDDGDDGDEEPMTLKMETPKNRNVVGPNTKVEVATFYSTIHFYNLKRQHVAHRDIDRHFSIEGKVKDVRLVVEPWSRYPEDLTFRQCGGVEEPDRCIKYLDRYVLEGRIIMVEKASFNWVFPRGIAQKPNVLSMPLWKEQTATGSNGALSIELTTNNPNMRIIHRKVALILGQWVSEKEAVMLYLLQQNWWKKSKSLIQSSDLNTIFDLVAHITEVIPYANKLVQFFHKGTLEGMITT
ncbi:hypothetical protein OROHE_008386 [Orobanche hederae]